MSIDTHLGLQKRKGSEDWVYMKSLEREALGRDVGEWLQVFLCWVIAGAIFLEKNKPLPDEKQLHHPVGYHSPHPLESCTIHPAPFFPFFLSFPPSGILTPAEETTKYTDSGGVRDWL